MELKLLECEVQPGMFSDESVVTVGVGKDEQSFFVPSRFVRTKGDKSYVEAKVFKVNEDWWAVIPSPEQPEIVVEESKIAWAS